MQPQILLFALFSSTALALTAADCKAIGGGTPQCCRISEDGLFLTTIDTTFGQKYSNLEGDCKPPVNGADICGSGPFKPACCEKLDVKIIASAEFDDLPDGISDGCYFPTIGKLGYECPTGFNPTCCAQDLANPVLSQIVSNIVPGATGAGTLCEGPTAGNTCRNIPAIKAVCCRPVSPEALQAALTWIPGVGSFLPDSVQACTLPVKPVRKMRRGY